MSFQPYLVDPKTNIKSVSLTLLVVSFTATIIAAGLQIAGAVGNVSVLVELTLSTAALYFGRAMTFKGQTYSASKAEEIVNKIEPKEEK
jgi:hypothetical protein